MKKLFVQFLSTSSLLMIAAALSDAGIGIIFRFSSEIFLVKNLWWAVGLVSLLWTQTGVLYLASIDLSKASMGRGYAHFGILAAIAAAFADWGMHAGPTNLTLWFVGATLGLVLIIKTSSEEESSEGVSLRSLSTEVITLYLPALLLIVLALITPYFLELNGELKKIAMVLIWGVTFAVNDTASRVLYARLTGNTAHSKIKLWLIRSASFTTASLSYGMLVLASGGLFLASLMQSILPLVLAPLIGFAFLNEPLDIRKSTGPALIGSLALLLLIMAYR